MRVRPFVINGTIFIFAIVLLRLLIPQNELKKPKAFLIPEQTLTEPLIESTSTHSSTLATTSSHTATIPTTTKTSTITTTTAKSSTISTTTTSTQDTTTTQCWCGIKIKTIFSNTKFSSPDSAQHRIPQNS